jgi:hypothetical protein
LDRAPEVASAQFRRQLSGVWRDSAPGALTDAAVPGKPAALTEWLTSTRTTDETIEAIGRTAVGLAEAHSRPRSQRYISLAFAGPPGRALG